MLSGTPSDYTALILPLAPVVIGWVRPSITHHTERGAASEQAERKDGGEDDALNKSLTHTVSNQAIKHTVSRLFI